MKTILTIISLGILSTHFLYATAIARTSNNGSNSPAGEVSVSQCCFPNGKGTAEYSIYGIGSSYSLIAYLPQKSGIPSTELEIGNATLAEISDQLDDDGFTP